MHFQFHLLLIRLILSNLKHHNCSTDNCLVLDNDSLQRHFAECQNIHCSFLYVCQFPIAGPPKLLTGPSTKARRINTAAYKAALDVRWVIRACATLIGASVACAGGGWEADATLSSWSVWVRGPKWWDLGCQRWGRFRGDWYIPADICTSTAVTIYRSVGLKGKENSWEDGGELHSKCLEGCWPCMPLSNIWRIKFKWNQNIERMRTIL